MQIRQADLTRLLAVQGPCTLALLLLERHAVSIPSWRRDLFYEAWHLWPRRTPAKRRPTQTEGFLSGMTDRD